MPGYVRAAQRREQLLAAAREVLVRDGLEHLTLRAVAAQADVHLSTLQYIFGSRAELVAALAERVLADAAYGQFEIGSDGLAVELHRLTDWFATQLFADPAMTELARLEFLARVDRRDPTEPIDFPAGRPILTSVGARRLDEIADRSGEAYALPVEDLGRLWILGLQGLLFEYLQDGDLARYRREGARLVDWIVQLAQPRTEPPDR
jgi:AcrR family transcriptional regulator